MRRALHTRNSASLRIRKNWRGTETDTVPLLDVAGGALLTTVQPTSQMHLQLDEDRTDSLAPHLLIAHVITMLVI